MSETGQLGQIGHSSAALKKPPTFLYNSFIRDDVFILHNKSLYTAALCYLSWRKLFFIVFPRRLQIILKSQYVIQQMQTAL